MGTGVSEGAAAATPFATSVSSNHRYLLDQAGDPFMIVGDSAHSMSVDLSPTQMAAYFADRRAHGFNSVLVQLICGVYTGNHNKNSANYATYDGITPFTTNGDISTPNPAYFNRMQTMARLAEKDGITLFLDPADTGQLVKSSQFLAHNGVTKDYNYGRFLGRTFKDFPNIVWESGNDYQKWGPVNDAYVLGIAKGIRSVDAEQLQSVELNYETSLSTDDPLWASFVNLNAEYDYYNPYAEVLAGYNFDAPTMPVFGTENAYEFETYLPNNPGSTKDLRLAEYWTMTSGATGLLYGSHYTWNDPSWTDERKHLDTTGVQQLEYMADLFKNVAWYNLVPDQTHTFVTAGYGTFVKRGTEGASDYVTAAVTPDGTLGVAYLPHQATVTVDMSRMSGPINARWYDPTAGTYSTIGMLANTGAHQFTSPPKHKDGSDDWVLILEA